MWLIDPYPPRSGTSTRRSTGPCPTPSSPSRACAWPRPCSGARPRHYFIAFTQPAEARGLGGFVGNYGELTAIDGDIELTRSGRIRELIAAPGADQRTLAARRTT